METVVRLKRGGPYVGDDSGLPTGLWAGIGVTMPHPTDGGRRRDSGVVAEPQGTEPGVSRR